MTDDATKPDLDELITTVSDFVHRNPGKRVPLDTHEAKVLLREIAELRGANMSNKRVIENLQTTLYKARRKYMTVERASRTANNETKALLEEYYGS